MKDWYFACSLNFSFLNLISQIWGVKKLVFLDLAKPTSPIDRGITVLFWILELNVYVYGTSFNKISGECLYKMVL